MNIAQLQIEIQRQAALELLVLLTIAAIWFWVMYAVTKAAIREGLKESGLIDELRALRRNKPEEHLPDWAAEK